MCWIDAVQHEQTDISKPWKHEKRVWQLIWKQVNRDVLKYRQERNPLRNKQIIKNNTEHSQPWTSTSRDQITTTQWQAKTRILKNLSELRLTASTQNQGNVFIARRFGQRRVGRLQNTNNSIHWRTLCPAKCKGFTTQGWPSLIHNNHDWRRTGTPNTKHSNIQHILQQADRDLNTRRCSRSVRHSTSMGKAPRMSTVCDWQKAGCSAPCTELLVLAVPVWRAHMCVLRKKRDASSFVHAPHQSLHHVVTSFIGCVFFVCVHHRIVPVGLYPCCSYCVANTLWSHTAEHLRRSNRFRAKCPFCNASFCPEDIVLLDLPDSLRTLQQTM